MRLRRCALLWLEPREEASFHLQDVFAGGTGVRSRLQWFAHAAHLPAPVPLEAESVRLLGEVGPNDWVDAPVLAERHGAARVQALAEAGLLVADDADAAHAMHRDADARARSGYWHAASALAHMASRWSGQDAVQALEAAGLASAQGIRAQREPPPPAFHVRDDGGALLELPRAGRAGFDELLHARRTCRNFDDTVALPSPALARVLERTFAAHGVLEAADGLHLPRKTSPSGGALHPTEAYLLLQHVDGVAPGLYHYRADRHALQALPWHGDAAALRALALRALAGQHWFANAHAIVVLAPRYARNFWKYRHHPKAYRVCILDVGHLSQTLLLGATEQGLGAFVTAAINEVDIEQAFGLDGLAEGPLAVCGFGPRAATKATPEFDFPA